MTEKTLCVHAAGGLCNRLKPIFSGLAIAERTGRRLRVYWDSNLTEYPNSLDEPITHEWPGSFSDLFSTQIEEISQSEAEALRAASPEWNDSAIWDFPICDPADPRLDILRCSWQFLRLPDEPSYDNRIDEFNPDIVKAFAACRPVPSIQARVDRFAAEHDMANFLSIHVRSQHCYCKKYIAADYIRAIERYRRTNPVDGIFISSDGQAIENEIRRAYPESVSIRKDSYACVPSLASGDAVIDLCLLARAKAIIGTPASTFAHVAWYLAGCRSQFIDVGM